MKAAAVEYVRPKSLAEAVSLLSQGNGEARVIAGGQSLLPMMNLRIAAPGLLIDIARLPELAGFVEDADAVTIGAAVTHAAIEDRRVPDPSDGLMPRAAAGLAYRAIRNLGTIGGSLALADPAAEWPAVLSALDAELRLRGPNGARSVGCAEFATGIFETGLAADEIIETVRIRKLSAGARWGYVKLSRKSGEFAHALAVALCDPGRGYARVVLGAGERSAAGAIQNRNNARRRQRRTRTCCGKPSPPISTAPPTAISTRSSAIFTASPRCARCGRRRHDRDPRHAQRLRGR